MKSHSTVAVATVLAAFVALGTPRAHAQDDSNALGGALIGGLFGTAVGLIAGNGKAGAAIGGAIAGAAVGAIIGGNLDQNHQREFRESHDIAIERNDVETWGDDNCRGEIDPIDSRRTEDDYGNPIVCRRFHSVIWKMGRVVEDREFTSCQHFDGDRYIWRDRDIRPYDTDNQVIIEHRPRFEHLDRDHHHRDFDHRDEDVSLPPPPQPIAQPPVVLPPVYGVR